MTRHRSRGAFLALCTALGLLASCGGAGATTLPPDDSTTAQGATEPRPRGAMLAANEEIRQASARGAIESITPEQLAPGYPVSRVVIAGDGPVEERSFRIGLPDDIAIPFAVGESIVLSIETLPGPPTWQPMNLVVTTDSGELLAMHGVLAPSGWTIDRAGVARREDQGDYDRIEQYVAFSHGGQRVVTEGGHWRALTSADGSWHVAGTATDLEGDNLPADGGPAISIMIVRAR